MIKVQEFMLYNKNEELVFIGTREEIAKFLDVPLKKVMYRIKAELYHRKTEKTVSKIYGYTIVPYEGDITDKGE